MKQPKPPSGAIKFKASIRPGTAGITIGDDGACMHLDISESELGNALQAVKLRGLLIEVQLTEA
jgi:hypothetical protein